MFLPKVKTTLCVAVAFSLVTGTVSGQATNTQRGAVAGGTAGAIIGGVIGHQNDETPEGILIGGVVGSIAGGLLGKQKDQIQQQLAYNRAVDYSRGVSAADVVHLTQSGVGSDVIITQIRNYGVKHRIGVNEIVSLHQSGVNNVVITEMQNARLAGKVTPAPVKRPAYTSSTVVVPRPVIYRSYAPVRPVPYRAGYHYRPAHHRGHRPHRR